MNSRPEVTQDSAYPSVSVIVANWNGKGFLEKCIESLLATDYPDLKVLVVDDCSSDSSSDEVAEKFSCDRRFSVVKNQTRIGLAPTFNKGYSLTSGDIVAFVHNDTYFHEGDWLARMVKALSEDDSIGAAQPKMLCLDTPGLKLGVGWDIDGLGYPVYSEFYAEDDPTEDSVTETFIAWNACLVSWRATLERVGPFESSFRTFGEDYDLSWRIRLSGRKVVCVRGSRILHQSSQAKASLGEESTFDSTKNHSMTLIRNMGGLMLATRFPIFFSGTVLLTLFDLGARPRLGRTRLRALKWLVTNMRQILAQRRIIQREVRKVDDSAIEKLMKPVSFGRYLGVVKAAIG